MTEEQLDLLEMDYYSSELFEENRDCLSPDILKLELHPKKICYFTCITNSIDEVLQNV